MHLSQFSMLIQVLSALIYVLVFIRQSKVGSNATTKQIVFLLQLLASVSERKQTITKRLYLKY